MILSTELAAEARHLLRLSTTIPALVDIATRLEALVQPARAMERTLDEIVADAAEDERITAAREGRARIIAGLLPRRGCHLSGGGR